MLKSILLVGAGGCVGAVCRYLVSVGMMVAGWVKFPVATLAVNLIGSLLIGLFMGLSFRENFMLLTITGFCGGFTTFSTFSAESYHMIMSGRSGIALVYILTSVVICILAVWAGLVIGTRFVK